MAENNVFQLGPEYLLSAQEALRMLEADKSKLEENRTSEKKAKKAIAAEEKSIQEEIDNTLKKRKEELAMSYDKQLDAVHQKVREVQTKRDRRKEKYVSARVAEETAEIKEENRKLSIEMKTMFKQEQVPAFCASSLYFSLYMPKRIGDFVRLFIVILIILLCLPGALYMGFKGNPLLLTILLTALFTLEFALYFIIFNITKLRHKDTLAEAGKIRMQMHANLKQMKAVKNSITKDKDESVYDLSKYDTRLQELEQEADSIASQKQNALTEFEQNSKNLVVEEIQNRRQPRVAELKLVRQQCEAEIQELEQRVKQESLEYTQKYEKYLGANLSKADGLSDLVAIMADGSANTVGDAIAVYKGESR